MSSWRHRAEQRRLAIAYRQIFNGQEGELVLANLAFICREGTTAVEGSSPLDPLVLAREEGKRSVWLHIKGMLALDRGEIERMLRNSRATILAEFRSVAEEAARAEA